MRLRLDHQQLVYRRYILLLREIGILYSCFRARCFTNRQVLLGDEYQTSRGA